MNTKYKYVVGTTFIRVIKNHDLYYIFKNNFNRFLDYKKDLYDVDLDDTQEMMFSNSLEIKDVFNSLDLLNDPFKFKNKIKRNKYDDIVYLTNILIHIFLENSIRQENLAKLGQEIFDLSCYNLFGDKYRSDIEKLNNEFINNLSYNNDMYDNFQEIYRRCVENGYNGSFKKFLMENTSLIKNNVGYD